MIKLEAFLLVGIFAMLSLNVSCKAEEKRHLPATPYYYGSFAGYQVPFRPSDPLSYEEAIKRESYYIAYFDRQGNIVSFTKYLNGKIFFKDKYFYRADGSLERREMTKSTGEVTTQYFDEAGKIIKGK